MPRLNVYEDGAAPICWQELGVLGTNVYIVEDGEGGVVVVDPAARPEAIMEVVGERPVTAIFVTHGHYDHVGALDELRTLTGAPVIASAEDEHRITDPQPGFVGRVAPASQVDRTVTDGETVQTGKLTWKVMRTPGHTEGSICFFLDPSEGIDKEGSPLLLSGDTLFHGTVGRTDLEGGSIEDMRSSMGRLAELPDETVVFPGHNSVTTIGLERKRTIEAILSMSWDRPVR